MNIVAIITARGGSTGLPRKNLLPLAGKPLIAHSILAALGAKRVKRVIVSTDSEEIAACAREWGAEVPFLRPAHLATADSAHIDVMLHAAEWLEQSGDLPDALLLLQPTTPMRSSEDLDGAAQILESTGCPAVVGVCAAAVHPYIVYKINESGQLVGFIDHGMRYPRRQDLPPAFQLNGGLYLNRVSSLRETHQFQPPGTCAWVMPTERSVDIDTLADFAAAEAVIESHSVLTLRQRAH